MYTQSKHLLKFIRAGAVADRADGSGSVHSSDSCLGETEKIVYENTNCVTTALYTNIEQLSVERKVIVVLQGAVKNTTLYYTPLLQLLALSLLRRSRLSQQLPQMLTVFTVMVVFS